MTWLHAILTDDARGPAYTEEIKSMCGLTGPVGRRNLGLLCASLWLTTPGCLTDPERRPARSHDEPPLGVATPSPAEPVLRPPTSARPLRPPLRLMSAEDDDCVPQPTAPTAVAESYQACKFPSAADRLGINFAVVTLRVCIDTDGLPRSAAILEDPGNGFAQAALACVAQVMFQPGRDANGAAAPSRLDKFRVRFTRGAPGR